VGEHLPARTRRAQVDEYYRVLAPGGHVAVLDTPNRWFPLETHSVGLPLVQWLPAPIAYRYARALRRRVFRDVPYAEFVADGTGWRNATLADCLPSSGWRGLEDVTEAAGYGWRFFRDTARSRTRRTLLPVFAGLAAAAPRVGLTRALNQALARARAPLVARLDADDLALPERLARQRAFLDAHPDVGLLGTGARAVDAAGREVAWIRPPEDDGALRRVLIRRNPFVHSSVMMRRAVVERAGGYDETLPVAQDYDLWMRMSRLARLANLSEPLVVRRLLPGRVTAMRDAERLRAEARVRWRAVRRGA